MLKKRDIGINPHTANNGSGDQFLTGLILLHGFCAVGINPLIGIIGLGVSPDAKKKRHRDQSLCSK